MCQDWNGRDWFRLILREYGTRCLEKPRYDEYLQQWMQKSLRMSEYVIRLWLIIAVLQTENH